MPCFGRQLDARRLNWTLRNDPIPTLDLVLGDSSIPGPESHVTANSRLSYPISCLTVFVLRSAEFLGESDEKPFKPADVAEQIRVLVLDYFAYELRAAVAEPFKRLVDVVHRKHDAQVSQGIDRVAAVIRNDGRSQEAGHLEPSVAVRRAHHGNLDALIGKSSDTSGPFSFDRGPPFEFEAELAKEINRRSEVLDDDSDVVHPLECHVSNLQGAAGRWRDRRRRDRSG